MRVTLFIPFFIFSTFISTFASNGAGLTYNLHNFDTIWSRFIKSHNKSYSISEKIKRKLIFYNNLNAINQHNSKANSSFRMKANQFTDLSPDEFRSRMNLKPKKFFRDTSDKRFLGAEKKAKVPTRFSLFDIILSLFNFGTVETTVEVVKGKEGVDWRALGHVTEPIYQGNCGGCWAIAAVGAAEAIYSIKNGQLKKLSAQCLLDCAKEPYYASDGCNGGYVDEAFSYIMKYGLPEDTEYPFVGIKSSRCQSSNKRNVVPITSYRDIETEEDLLAAVDKSPVPVAIDADQTSFKLYSSGVYDDPACTKDVNHAVLVVGYDSQSWIIKNSWGTSWGDKGFARIKRGNNMCGITQQTVVPIF